MLVGWAAFAFRGSRFAFAFRGSPSTWKTAVGFSGKLTPPWPAGKARLRCRGAVLRALFRRGGVGRWGSLVRIRSASAVGALGPHHLGGVFFVENLVAVAAFKCLLDHGGLLFRRGMRFGRAAVRASCPLHGKARPVFLENAKCLVDECWTLRLPEPLLSENAIRGPYCGHVARAEWGNSALGDICDLRFYRRGAGLLVMGSRKRGPLAAFSDNSARFLCSEAPSWHFLTALASLLSTFSVLPSAGRQRCGFQAAKRPQQSSTLLARIGLGLLNNQRRRGRGIH